MRVFALRPEEVSRTKYTGTIDAAHRWKLPGLLCDVCGGAWVMLCAFPTVDLSQLPTVALYEEARQEGLAEFKRLQQAVLPLVPRGFLPPPGTNFGPLVGTAWGTFPQIAWQNPWTLLIQRQALEQLQSAGVQGLVAVKPELRFRGKNPPELLELSIEPLADLHRSCLPERPLPPCSGCGLQDLDISESPIIDAKTLPPGVDLFQDTNLLFTLATERFVDAARRFDMLDDTLLREVPVR